MIPYTIGTWPRVNTETAPIEDKEGISLDVETITADYILVGDLRETGMSREKDIGHQQNYQNHQSEHSRQTSIKKTTEPYLRVLYNFQLSSLNFDIFQLLVTAGQTHTVFLHANTANTTSTLTITGQHFAILLLFYNYYYYYIIKITACCVTACRRKIWF